MKKVEINFNKELIKRSRFKKFQDFHNLMQFRIRDILLVSSLYDSYVFEEDGRLYELIRKEYHGLNLSHSPELIQVASGNEAIRIAKTEKRFNLIISTQHIEDMHVIEFAKKVKQEGIETPIILLGYDNMDLLELLKHPQINVFDKVFIWQGDYKIILGIIKFLEDKYNIQNDTNRVGVQVIIMIEDSVRFYSSYLPYIYTEVLKQAQSLISEGINLQHKFLRMRARPKIILCADYEEAWQYYSKYEEFILGIISDVHFNRNGKKNRFAGLEFAKNVRANQPDVPILLQSNNDSYKDEAIKIGASFSYKQSPTLLQEIREFMVKNFSFGAFVFKDSEDNVVGSANNLIELESQLAKVPIDSVVYHAQRNHFSNWLKARTEFWLAYKLRPKKVDDYASPEDLRNNLIESITEFRQSRRRGVILDFDKKNFENDGTFARIGGGSIGGKARGLGFVNNLLSNFEISTKFENVHIFVPTSIVIATDIFDQFLDENNLRDFALKCVDDEILVSRFLAAPHFPISAIKDLTDLLSLITVPIAVRSSSLLEDSQGQPFAGVYDTYMLPNNHSDINVRLTELVMLIKKIYASIFMQRAKDYIKVTTYRLEEEKMAVIIQKLVGSHHEERFYPDFSGVAKSYNFYPSPPLKSTDGIVSAALGLGKFIVEGGNCVRFCPKHPNHLMHLFNNDDLLRYSQQEFYSLDMTENDGRNVLNEDEVIVKHSIDIADSDGVLANTGSTYSYQNQVLYDGTAREGIKIFTLSPILKYRLFPLSEIIDLLLQMGSWGMGSPVEIEFAVNLSVNPNEPKQFGLLQMRPLVISGEAEELDLSGYEDSELLCKSSNVLGHGIVKDIFDVVYVDYEKFDRSKTRIIAQEIGKLNSKLIKEKRPYVLIGLGRWGTLDPWLGIPVTWDQISGAKAIVESDFKDFCVMPSQGSHFFQNITSFKVGYFTIHNQVETANVDWDWLSIQAPIQELNYCKLLRFDNPIEIILNGKSGEGIIIKPNN